MPRMILSPTKRLMIRNAKIKKTWNRLIQLAILILAYGFIYKEVFYKRNLVQILQELRDDFSRPGFPLLILLLTCLLWFNWAIESVKWKYLMAKIDRVGFWKAYQAVLAGVTISIFTPNRVGEYFGRVFILNSSWRVEGILVTILGSMGQLLVTIMTGSIALLAFLPRFLVHYGNFNGYLYYTLLAVIVGFNLLILGFYLNISLLSGWKEKMQQNRLRHVQKFFHVFSFYHTRELLNVLFLSLLRYAVFSFQFYLLLRIFAVPVPLPAAFMLISLVYFVMAVIPTVALTELGIRGSVALYIFGIYFENPAGLPESFRFGILAATTVLWAVNLGIPALVGSVFVFHLKFFRKLPNNRDS